MPGRVSAGRMRPGDGHRRSGAGARADRDGRGIHPGHHAVRLPPHPGGGHSQRRVVHAADLTGMEVERTLLNAAARAGVQFFEEHHAIDLILARGTALRRTRARRLRARHKTSAVHSFLGKRWSWQPGAPERSTSTRRTRTSPPATGWPWPTARRRHRKSGIHPVPSTCSTTRRRELPHQRSPARGGRILRNRAGDSFMERYDPRKELARATWSPAASTAS